MAIAINTITQLITIPAIAPPDNPFEDDFVPGLFNSTSKSNVSGVPSLKLTKIVVLEELVIPATFVKLAL